MDYSTTNESDMASEANSSISLFEEWLARPVNETDSKLCQSDHADHADQSTLMSCDIMNMNVNEIPSKLVDLFNFNLDFGSY